MSAIVSNALVLAGVTFIVLLILWHKMPSWAKKWMKKHPLLTDATLTVVEYTSISSVSSSLTALIATGILDILVGLGLMISPKDEEKKDE